MNAPCNSTKNKTTGNVTKTFSQYVTDQLNTIEAVSENLNLDPSNNDHVWMFIKHFRAVKKEFENEYSNTVFELPHVEPIEYHSADAKNKSKSENAEEAAKLDNSNATASANLTDAPPPADGTAPVPTPADPADAAPATPPELGPENLDTAQKANKTNSTLAAAQQKTVKK